MSRDLLSYCITDRASFKAVARAMRKRDGKWPKQIMVNRDVYRNIFTDLLSGEPGFTGFGVNLGDELYVFCVVEGMNNEPS